MAVKLLNNKEKELYVKEFILNGREDLNDLKYYKNSYEYIRFDRFDVVVKVRKPSIHSDLWYDDETSNPFYEKTEDERFSYFVRYNKRFAQEVYEEDYLSDLSFSPYGDSPFCLVKVNGSFEVVPYNTTTNTLTRYGFDADVEKFQLTDDEVKEYANAVEQLQQKFEKRLATYWNRYSSKVCTRGYWADR